MEEGYQIRVDKDYTDLARYLHERAMERTILSPFKNKKQGILEKIVRRLFNPPYGYGIDIDHN